MKKVVRLVFIMVIAYSNVFSQGDILLSDNFSSGLNGGVGWSGGWSGSGATTVNDANSFNYPTNTPDYLRLNAGSVVSRTAFTNSSGPAPSISGPWVSYLIKVPSNLVSEFFFGLQGSVNPCGSSGSLFFRLEIGRFFSTGSSWAVRNYVIGTCNGSSVNPLITASSTSKQINVNQDILIVINLITKQIFINPKVSLFPPTISDFTFNVNSLFNSFVANAGQEIFIDEVKVGTTFASVLPVNSVLTNKGLELVGSNAEIAFANNGIIKAGVDKFGIFIAQNNGNVSIGTTTTALGARLLVSGGVNNKNIGQLSTGTFGGIAAGNRWNAIGDRIPFNSSPGFVSSGLRSQWGQYGTDFGLVNRTDTLPTSVKDGLIAWQDITTTLDPISLTGANSRLRFVFRNGNVPSVTPNALEAMSILANGNVGIGTTSPFVKLQVQNGNIAQVTSGNLGNPADKWSALGVNAGATSGFSANVYGYTTNWANRGFYAGLLDNGSEKNGFIGWQNINAGGATSNRLIFAVITGAGSNANALERATILANGRVGIGFANPSVSLDVNGDVRCVSLTQTSDTRYKKNIKQITNAFGMILSMTGCSYEFKTNEFKDHNFPNGKNMGVIAQELQKVIPEAVVADNEGYLSVNYIAIIPVLIEALKENKVSFDKTIDSLSKEITLLKKKNKDGKDTKNVRVENETLISDFNSPAVLLQNIPNPFSSATSIGFEIPKEAGSASINIYDANGKPIKKYEIKAGEKSIDIQGKELPSGLYLYALIVDGKVIDIKKMILE